MTGKYLITTDNFFLCPDGKHYKAVWGDVKVLGDKEALGIDTNRNSSNWFAVVGNESKQVLIAGCQIHYAVRSETPPTLSVLVEEYREGKLETRDNIIYIAEDIEIPEPALKIPTIETLKDGSVIIKRNESDLKSLFDKLVDEFPDLPSSFVFKNEASEFMDVVLKARTGRLLSDVKVIRVRFGNGSTVRGILEVVDEDTVLFKATLY